MSTWERISDKKQHAKAQRQTWAGLAQEPEAQAAGVAEQGRPAGEVKDEWPERQGLRQELQGLRGGKD